MPNLSLILTASLRKIVLILSPSVELKIELKNNTKKMEKLEFGFPDTFNTTTNLTLTLQGYQIDWSDKGNDNKDPNRIIGRYLGLGQSMLWVIETEYADGKTTLMSGEIAAMFEAFNKSIPVGVIPQQTVIYAIDSSSNILSKHVIHQQTWPAPFNASNWNVYFAYNSRPQLIEFTSSIVPS